MFKLTTEEGFLDIWPGRELKNHFPTPTIEEALPQSRYSEFQGNDLLLAPNKGAFIKPCPATNNYNCCELWIFHFGQGCHLGCRYCILEAYLGSESLVLFGNMVEGLADLKALLAKPAAERPSRFCTGEFTDSLLFDHLTGLSTELISMFSQTSQAILELKTKTTNIKKLLGLKHNGHTVVSFSVNAPEICRTEEGKAAPLLSRLKAAQELANDGYPIGLHFDHLVLHDNWERGYQETIDLLEHYLNKATIAWISMGCFRFLPHLKEVSLQKYPDTKMFNPEFILAPDGKKRYPRPIRVAMYKFMKERLEKLFPKAVLYMCMESPKVWKEVFDFDPQTIGLKEMLDNRVADLTNL